MVDSWHIFVHINHVIFGFVELALGQSSVCCDTGEVNMRGTFNVVLLLNNIDNKSIGPMYMI